MTRRFAILIRALALIATVLALVATVILDQIGNTRAQQAAQDLFAEVVKNDLSSYVLGTSVHSADRYAISLWMDQINSDLASIGFAGPLSPVVVYVRASRIDDVTPTETRSSQGWSEKGPIEWSEEASTHALFWEQRVERRWDILAIFFSGIWAATFIMGLVLPRPLAPEQDAWFRRLRLANLPDADALFLVTKFVPECGLSQEADFFVQHLIDQDTDLDWYHILDAAQWVDSQSLRDEQWLWLSVGLRKFPNDVSSAKRLAQAEDVLRIDLHRRHVTVRGLPVQMTPTQLAYYALYAMERISGDGWIENPRQKGALDVTTQKRFLAIADQIGLDVRTERSIERNGITERMLANARNRIRDDLRACLEDERLAKCYLFEEIRNPRTDRYSCRLLLHSDQIRVEQTPL